MAAIVAHITQLLDEAMKNDKSTNRDMNTESKLALQSAGLSIGCKVVVGGVKVVNVLLLSLV